MKNLPPKNKKVYTQYFVLSLIKNYFTGIIFLLKNFVSYIFARDYRILYKNIFFYYKLSEYIIYYI